MKTLLLVDDDAFAPKMLEDMFRKEWKIVTETVIERIREIVSNQRPDLILLNVGLRRNEGEAMFDELQNWKLDVPIIVYSPSSLARTGRQLVKRGAFWHLTMPLNTDDLERILQIASMQEEFRATTQAIQRDFAQLDEGIAKMSKSLQNAIPEHFTFERDDLIQGIIDLLGDLLQVEKVSLMLLERQSGELRIKAAKGLDRYVIENTVKPIGEGIAGWVAREGKPLLIKNVDESNQFSESAFFQQYSTKSLVSVPLIAGDKVIGVLSANNKYTGASFDEHDLYMATIFSHLLLLTLQNAQLHYDRERNLSQDSTLGMLNRKITATLEPKVLFHILLNETRTLMNAEFAFLFLLDEKGTGCGIYYLEGKRFLESILSAASLRQWAMHRTAPIVMSGDPEQKEFQLLTNLLQKKIHSWVSVPIVLQEKLAGSLELASQVPRKFKESDKQFLAQVANQATLAISNSRLYLKLLHSLKEVSEARKEVEKIRKDQYL